MKNILKPLILIGIFITPFIAFIISDSMFFPYVVGKAFTFRILVEIIFGLYILLAFWDKDYRPKCSWLTRSLVLFTVVMFIADLLGENSYKSIWSNYERMEGFMFIVHLLMFYFIVSSVLKTKEIWVKLFKTSIVASVLMAFYSFLQLVDVVKIGRGGGTQLDGTLGNSTYLAIYLVFHIFICLYLLSLKLKNDWSKWVYYSIIFFESIILYFTATRGAILGILGGLLLVGLLLIWREKENKVLRKFSLYTIGSVIFVVLGFIFIRNSDFVKSSPVLSRFSTLSITELRTQGRYYVWPMAIKGIAERPILGWGQENFNFVFNKYYNPGLFGQEEWFDRTHNLFLDWLIAGGILGFLSYLSIYVALFYLIWKKESVFTLLQKSVITGMVSAYVFHNIFVFDNIISYIIFFSVLSYVHVMSVSDDKNKSVSNPNPKMFSEQTLKYIVLPIVLVSTVVVVYFINIPAILANKNIIYALTPQKDNNILKNLEYFKKSFSYNSFGSGEALEQLIQTSTKISPSQVVIPAETKKAFYDLTKEKIEEKIALKPNDARYLVFAGGFFNKIGQYDEALKYLEKALKESPQKQSIHFELGTTYLNKGDKQKMMEFFKKAYELKPEAIESKIIYTVGAIYNKDLNLVKELVASIPEEKYLNDDRFVRAYYGVGDYNSAIEILNKRIEKNNSLQDKFTLAEIYLSAGQKQKTVELIKQMIVQEPSFKEQGEAYIKQIQNR